MTKRKYEKPLAIDMPFEEALTRFGGVSPKEMQRQILPDGATGQQDFEVVRYGSPGREVEMLLDKERETVWATQQAIGSLFDRDTDTVGEHIANIFAVGEAEEPATTGEFPVVRLEGNRQVRRLLKHYNGLHILCEQFLLFAESRALRGQKLTMEEMASKFDELLRVQGHHVFTEYKDYLVLRSFRS